MAVAVTHIFRVALRDQPSIHRGIEIDSAKSQAEFAESIVGAFGFEFDHAFGFYAETEGRAVMRGRPAYELCADMGEATEARSVKRTKVAEAFTEIGRAMTLLFDYGDEWLFRVELTALGRKAAKVRYPRVLAKAGRRRCRIRTRTTRTKATTDARCRRAGGERNRHCWALRAPAALTGA